jgi:membrane-associated phospholipid phosphatase
MIPLAGASAAAFATDTHTMRDVVSHDPSFNNTAINISNGLLYSFIGVPATMFVAGNVAHDDHARETGILAGEAVIDAYVVDEITKLCTFRERPAVDNARGDFYIGNAGVNSSFVSGHSMLSWSSAAVIAGEYHSKWVKLAAYTAATGVSTTRVLGREHFPTDVLIGGAGGWLIGHFVYRAHHHADVPAS